MSEYWKSTPKYWCKHCTTYVKDTPFERKQHESTGKHQGNLKRFLRGIQNDHERSVREKDKVKAEVERLNKVVGEGSSGSVVPAKQPTVRKIAPTSLSAADQKKQWAQLAEMGIQVPDGFRGDMALPGEWQKVAERPVEDVVAQDSLSTGIRKRKYEGKEEEEEAGETIARRGWGSTTRRYPGDDHADLDTLLSGPVIKKDDAKSPKYDTELSSVRPDDIKIDLPAEHVDEVDSKAVDIDEQDSEITIDRRETGSIKDEPPDDNGPPFIAAISDVTDTSIFKKRKAKSKAK